MAAHLNSGGVLFVEPWVSPENFRVGTLTSEYIDEPQRKIARMLQLLELKAISPFTTFTIWLARRTASSISSNARSLDSLLMPSIERRSSQLGWMCSTTRTPGCSMLITSASTGAGRQVDMAVPSPLGYVHPRYAASFPELGTPREFVQCEGWILERRIPTSDLYDGMGCYPLFACRNWSRIASDLLPLRRSTRFVGSHRRSIRRIHRERPPPSVRHHPTVQASTM